MIKLLFWHEMIFGVKPKKGFLATFILLIALIIIGVVFYSLDEHWSIVDALYFSVTTITTVSCSLYPDNNVAKLFTVFYSLCGIGIGALFLSTLAKTILNSRDRRIDQLNSLLDEIKGKINRDV